MFSLGDVWEKQGPGSVCHPNLMPTPPLCPPSPQHHSAFPSPSLQLPWDLWPFWKPFGSSLALTGEAESGMLSLVIGQERCSPASLSLAALVSPPLSEQSESESACSKEPFPCEISNPWVEMRFSKCWHCQNCLASIVSVLCGKGDPVQLESAGNSCNVGS